MTIILPYTTFSVASSANAVFPSLARTGNATRTMARIPMIEFRYGKRDGLPAVIKKGESHHASTLHLVE